MLITLSRLTDVDWTKYIHGEIGHLNMPKYARGIVERIKPFDILVINST